MPKVIEVNIIAKELNRQILFQPHVPYFYFDDKYKQYS
jgi:hypothetical protein